MYVAYVQCAIVILINKAFCDFSINYATSLHIRFNLKDLYQITEI